MENERIVEILQIIEKNKNHLNDDRWFGFFICNRLMGVKDWGLMSQGEYNYIFNLLRSNKPTKEKYPELLPEKYYSNINGSWWPADDLKSRQQFLNKLIEDVKQNKHTTL